MLTVSSPLPADDYQVYIPNQVEPGNLDTRIYDIYQNQLDGENLGDQTSQTNTGTGTEFPNSPVNVPVYEDLQSSGTYRPDDLSGDGIPGGAFVAGFTVVPYENVIHVQPGYVENPLVPSTLSTGSLTNPFPVLAPEGNPTDPNVPLNSHGQPNLNSTYFYQPGKFNTAYDFSGDGVFEQSALYAAAQASYNGPVVVVAEAGIPQRNPITGQIVEPAYVLQAPAGNNSGVTNGSVSVPFNTTLLLEAGATVKLLNANIYVRNQGSALQAEGTSSNPVTFTSYNNAALGGATNNNPDTNPNPGDWGGIVFRNYDQAAQPTVTFADNGPGTTLFGPNGSDAISGASPVMSILNNFTISYGGGAVPEGSSNFYSAITLYGSAPTISSGTIADTGSASGGTEAAIAGDLDSFLETDTTPDGPLIRRMTLQENSLNGLWLISEANGFIESTNAMPNIPTNPSDLGGSQNYNFFEPLPFVVLAQIVVGQELLENTGGDIAWVPNRLDIEPGVMLKFNKGSGLDLLNPAASLNVGSRSYITGFDQNNDYSPETPGFVEELASDPTVLFTSLYDDLATTTVVPAINVTNESAAQSTARLVAGAWGSVGIQSGGIAVINAATFQYGGGEVNTQDFTIPSQSVLAFITEDTDFITPDTAFFDLGTHVYITNNNFFNNLNAAMQIEPNGLMAGDQLTPLVSGNPFLRGNVMTGNGIDGLMVLTTFLTYLYSNNYASYLGPVQAIEPAGYSNLSVDSVWDLTDVTYVLQGTLIINGAYGFGSFGPGGLLNPPVPSITAYGTIPTPVVSLTIQAALPGTLLADGETIPSPGQSVIVKLYNQNTPNDSGSANLASTDGSVGINSVQNAGAGFVVGVDDGVDPPASPLTDPGAYSELRILGVPGNQTTGQQRVPVIITSLRDDTVGNTVRGVVMDDIWNSASIQTYQAAGNGTTFSLTTPAAGDGGYIYLGALSLNEYDPTNPLEGSLIDNADISYMSRIEVQGGGIIDQPIATTDYPSDLYTVLAGNAGPSTQFNAAFNFTIDDSNLSDFSDAAVFVHPDSLAQADRIVTAEGASFPTRGSLVGEPVNLYMYNDTISNSGQGVHINSYPSDDSTGSTPFEAILLNNTFYNDGYDIQTIAPAYDGKNGLSVVNLVAMNNIFDGASQVAVNLTGPSGGWPGKPDSARCNTTSSTTTSPTCWLPPTTAISRAMSALSSPIPISWGPSVPAMLPLRTSSSSPTRPRSTRLAVKSDRTPKAMRSTRPSISRSETG